MIFKRFLTRKTSSSTLPTNQDALVALVRSDQDTARRLEACRRVNRLSALHAIAETDIDAGMREIAQARYRKLLCGLDESSPPLPDRLAEIAALDDQRILEHIASNAHEPDVRLAAIEHLLSPEALAFCAVNDGVTAIRCTAVKRLNDKQALEQVARQIGKKDKNVYRITRHKLKEITEREALPKRIRHECEALCEKLKRLGRFENWVQDRALLDLIDRQWAEIESQTDEAMRSRYNNERDRFLSDYAAYRKEHEAQIAEGEARNANRTEREELIEQLKDCLSLSDEETLNERIADITQHWDALDPLPEAMLRPLEHTYTSTSRIANERLDNLRTQRKAAVRFVKLMESARKMLDQSRPIDAKQSRKLLQDTDALIAAGGMDKTLGEGFEEIRNKLEERLAKQIQHAERRLEEAQAKLSELSEVVEAGELKRAEPLCQSLQACIHLGEISGLPHKRLAAISEGLRNLAPRVRDLQKWRKWGTDTHREGLCQSMETFETMDMPLEAKALRLHDLQMEWKGLDQGGSPVNQSLWDRFHAASDKVYACCKPYLDQQAAERETARVEREALCQQMEDFLAQVDWERIDWKQTLRAEREMRKGWAAMGEVEGRHRRSLEKRFHRAIKQLDERLSEERSKNRAFKRGLIDQVEALVEEPDLESAIESCKRLQREWHTTVPDRQKDENKLWQRFRYACDAVFARRRQQHEAYAAELDENLKIRRAICAEAESLAASDLDSEALRNELRAIKDRWRNTESLSLPRGTVSALNEHWRAALHQVTRRQQQILKAQRLACLDLLERQAAVCEDLERKIEADLVDANLVAHAEAAWSSLPRQSEKTLQQSIEKRYKATLEAASNGGASLRSALDSHAKHRAELCLHLEILAQIESPPECVQERLAFQVNRLKEHMRAGEKDPLAGAARLVERWYLCGPAPAVDMPSLEARFIRARDAIDQSGQESEAA